MPAKRAGLLRRTWEFCATASPEEIKRAYYAAARRFHPDQNRLPGETELFLEVQRAYEVLSNPERRSRYDATLPQTTVAARFAHPDQGATTAGRAWCSSTRPQLIYTLLEARALEPQGIRHL